MKLYESGEAGTHSRRFGRLNSKISFLPQTCNTNLQELYTSAARSPSNGKASFPTAGAATSSTGRKRKPLTEYWRGSLYYSGPGRAAFGLVHSLFSQANCSIG